MPEMTTKEFMELVEEMRKKQRLYFSTRNRDVMRESQQLERRVDTILAGWHKRKNSRTQQTMFGGKPQ